MKEQIPAIKMKASKMKNYHKHLVLAAIGLFMSPMILPLRAASTEADQIKLLAPANSDRTITSAMTQLERMHTKNASCTNAIPALKLLLADNRSPVRRKAGRILGIFHAPLTDAELRQLCTQLKADDWGEVQSCLKALRDLGSVLAPLPLTFPGVRVENKGASYAVHFRGVSPHVQRRVQLLTRRLLARIHPNFRVIQSNHACEIVPLHVLGKGVAMREFTRKLPAPFLPIYVGDDLTDEPAFLALRGGITVRVGPFSRTHAHFRLKNPEEVCKFLERLEVELT